MHNQKYFLTIVDGYTRFTWVYLMKAKSEASQLLISFVQMVQTQFGSTVKVVRSDNGCEFNLPSFYSSKGIIHQTTCVNTPEQNGLVERKHQHILNLARSLRIQSNVPIKFWGYCISHATYLINRLPTPVLKNKTPYKMLYEKLPDYTQLRVFGSLVHVCTPSHNRAKFDPRSVKCVFLGFPTATKGYIVTELHSGKICVSRDVVFSEHLFPFQDTTSASSSTMLKYPLPVPFSESTSVQSFQPQDHDHSITQDPDPTSQVPPDTNEPSVQCQSETFQPNTSLRRSSRANRPPKHLQAYHCNNILYPLTTSVKYGEGSSECNAVNFNTGACQEPNTFLEAMKSVEWQNAMEEEIKALQANNTWSITELPKGKTPIGCKWVYKLKLKPDGSIDRYKARLVVKGFTQQEGVDYHDTFSPVAKLTTVRMMLAMAAAKKWELHQLGVNNAFLHGELEEDIYMALPPGFEANGKGAACKLHESIYGLKQASRQWNAKLTEALLAKGFQRSYNDYSLFTYKKGSVELYLLVYVDDIIITSNDQSAVTMIKQYLHNQFSIKDIGRLTYFLGVEVNYSTQGLMIYSGLIERIWIHGL